MARRILPAFLILWNRHTQLYLEVFSLALQDLAEVNGYQKKHLPHYTDINFMFDTITLFRTHQEINRKNVKPVHFELIHLWVDLRNNYQT